MRILKLLIFVFTTSQLFYGQQDVKLSIIDPFQKDALYREKVFIHLNKSIYFSNENIWFTTYVVDDALDVLSEYTSNLHVNLLDLNGNIIDSKILFIKGGIGKGNFLITKKYAPGTYFVQGFTKNMLNFGKEIVFVQKIEIINLDKNLTQKDVSLIENYDIQIFPESGYLLENTENSIGIKSLTNGKGLPFSGKIVNSKNEEVSTFKGNPFGMCKSSFFYAPDETYTAIININNSVQKIEVPKAKKTGVNFKIDNTDDEILKLTLNTNTESLPSLASDQLSIIIYRNTFICDAITLSINNTQSLKQDIYFDKKKLLNGVNTISLFRNNQPIAERKVFVDKSYEKTTVLIDKLKEENDSLSFKLTTIDSDFNPIVTQMSLSVLPTESATIIKSQNIKSAFLLTPYIKGVIENPSYYFENINETKKENLDILLINQGWVTYSLEEKIKEINPKNQYDFESGFLITGQMKKTISGYDIALLSKSNKIVSFSKFDENGNFTFDNIFAYKKDSIKVALVKKGIPFKKPVKISLSNVNKKNYKILTDQYQHIDNTKPQFTTNSILGQNLKSENLDEVILKSVKNKREETIYDKEIQIAENRREIAASFYQNKKVTEKIERDNKSALDYLSSLGYVKYTTHGNIFISLRNAITTISNTATGLNPNNTYPPRVYVDGISIMSPNEGAPNPSTDPKTGIVMTGNTSNYGIEVLRNLDMTEVDEVLINKTGAGGGMMGMGGTIKFYLKKGDHKYYETITKDLYEQLILNTGFDRTKEYYTPLYSNFSENIFNWIEIDWKNSIKTNEDGEAVIKIPTNKISNDFQLIINGVSKEGLLIHHIYKTNQEEF